MVGKANVGLLVELGGLKKGMGGSSNTFKKSPRENILRGRSG